MHDRTISIILAGGVGSRLHPLTAERAKPAVPFGGRYRIIDFTLSNCLHSGLRRILVLTQYKSQSLQKHLRDAWSIFNSELGEYITPVPPQMRTGESWYSGTADAIYQNLYLLERSGADYALILSGDHIYRMDYAAMLQHHFDSGAELTVACLTVEVEDATSFGVVTVDEKDRIVSFHEKPQEPRTIPGDPKHALASMGVYVFFDETSHRASPGRPRRRFRTRFRQEHHSRNGRQAPGQCLSLWRHQRPCHRRSVLAGRGTIDAYYDANMDLLQPLPAIDLYQGDWPIRPYEGQHPSRPQRARQDGTRGGNRQLHARVGNTHRWRNLAPCDSVSERSASRKAPSLRNSLLLKE
jgi:glucose-1-phosphate adenylyltransferase